jgi:hypothetical protein
MDHSKPVAPAGPSQQDDGTAPVVGQEGRVKRLRTASGRLIVRNTRRIRGLFDIDGIRAKVEWLELNE